jgi:hypothetical protein
MISASAGDYAKNIKLTNPSKPKADYSEVYRKYGEETGNAVDDVLDVMGKNKSKYYNNRNFDCSEIAEDLFNASGGKGEIIEITGNNGLRVKEYGEIMDFEYHEVFSDGKYIYDPRYSDNPILKSDYLDALNNLNSGGININKVQ